MFSNTLDLLDKYMDNETDKGFYNILESVKDAILYDIKSLENNIEYNLQMIAKDSRLETINDVSYSVTELYNIIFIQPLTPLCENDYSILEQTIASNLDLIDPNKRFILIPYDIKLLKVAGKIRSKNK